MEEVAPDSVLLGEVWEDASNKIAYSKRRKYLLGDELHGVMNYPFRTALLAYLQGGDADGFREAMETLRENYPPAAFSSLMNFLGTHDTPRILTVLGADRIPRQGGAGPYTASPRLWAGNW
ncbi:MAG: alpha-amylase family glycosyl hydrolase, partial [Dysosmobacter welbionis]